MPNRIKPIYLNISNPCEQSWDNMQRGDTGRFCTHCQKSVIDFTTWSDTALFNFFHNNSSKVCGRFLSNQLNKPIHIPYQPHSKLYKLMISAGLVLMFAQPAAAQTWDRNKPPLASQTTCISGHKPDSLQTPHLGSIEGTILDNKKQSVIGVVVTILQDGKVIEGAQTDADGHYRIESLAAGTYSLDIKGMFYKELIIHDIIIKSAEILTVNATVEKGEKVEKFEKVEKGDMITGDVEMINKVPLTNKSTPNKTTIDHNQIEQMPVK